MSQSLIVVAVMGGLLAVTVLVMMQTRSQRATSRYHDTSNPAMMQSTMHTGSTGSPVSGCDFGGGGFDCGGGS